MFCGKCGAKNEDHVGFCANCGAKLNSDSSTPTVTLSTPSQNHQNRKVGIIAVAVVAVAVVLLGIFLFSGRSYKSTVEKYIDYQFDGNAEGIINLMPDKMLDYAMEQDGYAPSDLDEAIADMNDELQDQLDTLDSYFEDGWDISYKIIKAEDVKGDDLDDIKDSYADADIKVSAAKSVEVELTITSGETESSNSMYIDLVKVGRSWYLDVASMGNLF